MSQTFLTEILAKFKERFPPAPDLQSSKLLLTSTEIIAMIEEFGIEEDIQKPTIISELQRLGYTYEPIEYNEKIHMKWLISSSSRS